MDFEKLRPRGAIAINDGIPRRRLSLRACGFGRQPRQKVGAEPPTPRISFYIAAEISKLSVATVKPRRHGLVRQTRALEHSRQVGATVLFCKGHHAISRSEPRPFVDHTLGLAWPCLATVRHFLAQRREPTL